jgi:hypothetical protein
MPKRDTKNEIIFSLIPRKARNRKLAVPPGTGCSLHFLARQYTYNFDLASVRAFFLLRAKVGACFVLVAPLRE